MKDARSKQVIIGDKPQNDHGVVRAMRANKVQTKDAQDKNTQKISLGNNPMVGATVAVAVAVYEAMK